MRRLQRYAPLRHVRGASRSVAALGLRQATPIERARPLGIELERGVELGGGLRVVALLQVDDAEIVVGVGIVGLQLQRLVAVGDRLGIVLAQRGARQATVVVGGTDLARSSFSTSS